MATTKSPAKSAKPAPKKSASKKTVAKGITPTAKPKAAAVKAAPKKAEAKKPATKTTPKKAEAKKPAAAAKAPAKKPAAKTPAKKPTAKTPVKKSAATAKTPAKKPAAKAKAPAKNKAAAKDKAAAVKSTAKKADKTTVPPSTSKVEEKASPLKPNYGIIRPSGAKAQKASAKPTSTKSRLSDATLEAFRKRLLADRAAIEAQLNAARSNALRQTDEENQEEDGSNSFNRAADLNRADDQHKRLRAIDDALLAIKNKTYGICSMCGKPIPRDRLEAAPFAIRCVACKEIWEKTMAKERNQSL